MSRLWIDTGATLAVANASTDAFSLMTGLTTTESRLAQMTLLRTIIGINLGYSVHDSGEGSQLVSVGIGITSNEAFATAGALPDPEVDLDFPARGWVWRGRYRVFGFAADQPAIFTQRVDLDMRSQRKLESGLAYLIVRNEAVEGVATTIQMTGLIRQLWLVK